MNANRVDMEQTLVQLNEAVNHGLPIRRGELSLDIFVYTDNPNGVNRATYFTLEGGQVTSMVAFCQTEYRDGEACFNVGYAVEKQHRGKSLCKETFQLAMDELKLGMNKIAVSTFWVEAGVELDNIASQKVATSVLDVEPIREVDPVGGSPFLKYLKRVI